MKELCNAVIGNAYKYHILSSGMFGVSAKIPSGAEITLIKIFFPDVGEDQLELIEVLAEKAVFVINYESIYGEKFSYRTDE